MDITQNNFLPISRADMEARGWEQCDFVYVCGDAYVDHPSFGAAIIARTLESNGYKVGMVCQPDWHDPESVCVLGRPRLAFLVSAGNMDSMVNHYTVAKKRRNHDSYSPGGEMGLRPDNATVVYSQLIRRTYKDVPIVLGGVEASLRRLAHYDYWSDKLKRSVLLDSAADLLVYGMGERAIVAVADALAAGIEASQITWISGTVFRAKSVDAAAEDAVTLPSWEAMAADKLEYAKSFQTQYRNIDPFAGKQLIEPYERDGLFVIQNTASEPLSTEEFDAVYRLSYMRTYHPVYEKAGGVPAIEEVKFSITSNRGCFGECAFCSLAFHQGRIVQSRSHESILEEARLMTQDPEFKGYIHDVGGPTANFRHPACAKQLAHGACVGKRCLSPKPCRSMKADHRDYLDLLRKLRVLPGVKKVFIRSGVRFDYVMLDKHGDKFIEELVEHHVSGQLRLAPEHVSDSVLDVMGKPGNEVYRRFTERFDEANRKKGKKQFVLPYLMSSHPGSTMKEAVELAEFCRDMGFNPEQVSDFYPTPSTISTCIYYTGVDPRTMKEVYCPRSPHEKAMQRALIQYRNPKNRDLVEEALTIAGRRDLIGYGSECLIRPRNGAGQGNRGKASEGKGGKFGKSGGAGPKRSGKLAAMTPESSKDGRHAGKGAAKSGGRKRDAGGRGKVSYCDSKPGYSERSKQSRVPKRDSHARDGKGRNHASGNAGSQKRKEVHGRVDRGKQLGANRSSGTFRSKR
ncbi:MAG: YgiQ family radical SAM protein [Eggerthellaceae bacterium]